MTEDVFRWIVTAGVAIAAVAFLVQAGLVFALYATVRRLERKAEPAIDRAEPVIEKLGPMVDRASAFLEKAAPVVEKAGASIEAARPAIEKTSQMVEKAGQAVEQANVLLGRVSAAVEDARPTFHEIMDQAVDIAKSGREQVEHIGELVNDAGDRARARLEQIDRSVESTVDQVEEVSGAVKRVVLKPVREVNGLAAGISAAVSSLVKGQRRPSVDKATQDEEMFI